MSSITLEQLVAHIMRQAKEKGFGTTSKDIHVGEKIALIHSEVSEAYEAYRKKNMDGKDGFAEELGDSVQRVLHLSGAMGIDIESALLKKLKSNEDREWKWDELNESHS